MASLGTRDADAVPSPTNLRALPTSRGEYRLSSFDLWKERHHVASVANVLRPESRVCLIGSCFAEQAAQYLRRRGYEAWDHPAGELYNAQSVRLELEHVLDGTEWPADIVVPIPGEGVVHRFRKRCRAADAEALRRLDEEQTAAATEALLSADVVIVLLGTTTELWRDSETGLLTNEIPHPAVFRPNGWMLDAGDLDDLRDQFVAIQDVLARHTSAAQVYSVCPIPLNATWTDEPIIMANGRNKALLRVAVEAGLKPGSIYLDLWDWVQAQTRWWTPMQADGRHLSVQGIDRIMSFAERRLGVEDVSLPTSHRFASLVADLRRTAGRRIPLRRPRTPLPPG